MNAQVPEPVSFDGFKADWPRGNYSWIPQLTLSLIALMIFGIALFRVDSNDPEDILFKITVLAIPASGAAFAIWRIANRSPFLTIYTDKLTFHPSMMRKPIRREQLKGIIVNTYDRFDEWPNRWDLSELMEKTGKPIPHIVINYFTDAAPTKTKKFLWVTRGKTAEYAHKLKEFGWL